MYKMIMTAALTHEHGIFEKDSHISHTSVEALSFNKTCSNLSGVFCKLLINFRDLHNYLHTSTFPHTVIGHIKTGFATGLFLNVAVITHK